MNLNDLFLCATAVLAGMINSVAGGGTLLTFPALNAALGTGAEALVLANGTSNVALWPGSLAATWGYRQEFQHAGRWLWWLIVPSVIGGLAGAMLVVKYPAAFESLVPWLILAAALLFALQPKLAPAKVGDSELRRPTALRMAGILLLQLVVALYGGYFGAGIGILMLASLGMMGLADIHVMNGVKNVCATCINGMATIVFIVNGQVNWRLALPMLVSAIVGGYLGAHLARRTNRTLVRRIVVVIGFSLATYYFWRRFHG